MRVVTRRRFLQIAGQGVSLVAAGCAAGGAPVSNAADEPMAATPTENASAAAQNGENEMNAGGEADAVSLDVKIGQMFMVGFRGLRIEENPSIVADIRERHLGGVVLFNYDVPSGQFVRNVESPEQVRALNGALQDAAEIPLLIATDQEGGIVARLSERFGFPPTLSHQALGEMDDVEATFRHAAEMARTLAEAGINQNLAPVVDLNVYPESPAIGAYERSFSADPQKVIAHARAFIQAHHQENVLCTLKHFPGHGSARDDSHRGFVDVTDTWSNVELEPYAALIEEGLADAVMTAHVFNRAWSENDPATLAPAAIDGLLRGELNYDGVIFSDDMQMGAIVEFYGFEEGIRKTLEAGVDVIAIANNSVYDEQVMAKGVAVVKNLVETGILTPGRIDASYRRIMAMKARLARA